MGGSRIPTQPYVSRELGFLLLDRRRRERLAVMLVLAALVFIPISVVRGTLSFRMLPRVPPPLLMPIRLILTCFSYCCNLASPMMRSLACTSSASQRAGDGAATDPPHALLRPYRWSGNISCTVDCPIDCPIKGQVDLRHGDSAASSRRCFKVSPDVQSNV